MKSNRQLKIGLGVILIICILFLPGCWGKREVEELAPLLGVGIDLGQKPGTYLITEQIAEPKQGGATASEVKQWTVSVEVSSAREAYEMVSKITNLIPFMGSLKVIVIGEDAAKAGFNDIIDFAQRFSEFRRSMYLLLAKGKAQSLLNTKLRSGEIPAIFLKSNLEKGENSSTFPIVRLGHYLTILGTETTAPIIPLAKSIKSGDEGIEYKADEKEGEELQLEGAGVLKGDHLVDFLTDEETKGYMWLENDVLHRFINTVGIDESKVNFGGQVLKSTTIYKVKSNNGTMELHYQINASIAVDEVMGLKEKLSDTEWLDLLKEAEKRFAKVIQKECELSIQKEKKLGLDFLGIGRHIEQYNSGYWKTVKDQWEQNIADFPISLDVKVTIHNSGMSSSSAND